MKRLILLGVLFFTSPVSAQSAKDQLLMFGKGLNSATTTFQQTVTGPNGEKLQSSQGVLEMQLPNKFRWEYKAPLQQLIIADGRNILVYEPDLKQLTIKKQDALNQDNPLSALSRPELLERYYSISPLPAKQGLNWLQLVPKNKDTSPFDKAWLAFDASGLRSMRLFDTLGQVSEFTFGTWQRNTAINPKRFSFKAPAGVDIVE
jgi:outer membrane lipoprotein carrier protein